MSCWAVRCTLLLVNAILYVCHAYIAVLDTLAHCFPHLPHPGSLTMELKDTDTEVQYISTEPLWNYTVLLTPKCIYHTQLYCDLAYIHHHTDQYSFHYYSMHTMYLYKALLILHTQCTMSNTRIKRVCIHWDAVSSRRQWQQTPSPSSVPPTTTTTYSHHIQPPHTATTYNHHIQPPSHTTTTYSHHIQPPHTATTYSHHHIQPPSHTITTYSHHIQPPHTNTTYKHHIPSPHTITTQCKLQCSACPLHQSSLGEQREQPLSGVHVLTACYLTAHN